MRLYLFSVWVAAALLGSSLAAVAQETGANTNGFTALIARVQADINAGKRTPVEFADDLRQLEVLLAAENGRRT